MTKEQLADELESDVDTGASLRDRATAAEPEVSALRDGIPSAVADYMTLQMIREFRKQLPGWWFSIGECSVSSDASCGPDVAGPDANLLKQKTFDEGFHADLVPPATMADALAHVMGQAIKVRTEALENAEQ